MSTNWEIASFSGGKEVLKETGTMGRFLFDIEERPGLGIDAERIRATMAAAPELLEAAKWALTALGPYSKDPAPNSGFSRLCAAILKAEGR